jgi:hypothetical protein
MPSGNTNTEAVPMIVTLRPDVVGPGTAHIWQA